MRKMIVFGSMAALAIGGALAQSDSDRPSSSSQSSATSSSDRERTGGTASQTQSMGKSEEKREGADVKFIEKAAIGGLAEVELGRLAVKQASSDEVKKFGQQMIDDHGKVNDQLKSIAQRMNVTVPKSLDSKNQRTFDKLQKLSGAEFDREYMKTMVSDHKDDVSEFEKESKDSKDPELQQFARETLTKLQQHLEMAKQLDASIGKNGAAAGAHGASGTGTASGTVGDAGTGSTSTGRGDTADPNAGRSNGATGIGSTPNSGSNVGGAGGH